jgi:hypothetical protein
LKHLLHLSLTKESAYKCQQQAMSAGPSEIFFKETLIDYYTWYNIEIKYQLIFLASHVLFIWAMLAYLGVLFTYLHISSSNLQNTAITIHCNLNKMLSIDDKLQ